MKTAKKTERTDDNPFALNELEMQSFMNASEEVEEAKGLAAELFAAPGGNFPNDDGPEIAIGLAERVFCLKKEYRDEAIDKVRRSKEIAMAVHDVANPSAEVVFFWFDKLFGDGSTMERLDLLEEKVGE